DTSDYGKHLRRGRRISFRVIDADHGCHRAAYGPYLESLGWQCTIPDRRVRLRADELPPGRLIVELRGHLVAVINGTVRDPFPSSSRKQVKSYWTQRAAS